MPEVSGDDWEADSQNCGDGTISRSHGPCRAPLGALLGSRASWLLVGVQWGMLAPGRAAGGHQGTGWGSHLLFLAIRGLWDKAHVALFHVRAGGAGRVDAESVSSVPAAEVGAAPELVAGLGVGAAAGPELRAGGLAAAWRGQLTWGPPLRRIPPLPPAPCILCSRPWTKYSVSPQHPIPSGCLIDHLASLHLLRRKWRPGEGRQTAPESQGRSAEGLGSQCPLSVPQSPRSAQSFLQPPGSPRPPGHLLAPALDDGRVLLGLEGVAG